MTLYRDRYYNHILHEHTELKRDYELPAQHIEHALTNAAQVRPGQGGAVIYIGPSIQANPPAGAQRIHVVVLRESDGDGWWVVTAYGVIDF